MKGIRIVKHYTCSTCGCCFFDDRNAAKECCTKDCPPSLTDGDEE